MKTPSWLTPKRIEQAQKDLFVSGPQNPAYLCWAVGHSPRERAELDRVLRKYCPWAGDQAFGVQEEFGFFVVLDHMKAQVDHYDDVKLFMLYSGLHKKQKVKPGTLVGNVRVYNTFEEANAARLAVLKRMYRDLVNAEKEILKNTKPGPADTVRPLFLTEGRIKDVIGYADRADHSVYLCVELATSAEERAAVERWLRATYCKWAGKTNTYLQERRGMFTSYDLLNDTQQRALRKKYKDVDEGKLYGCVLDGCKVYSTTRKANHARIRLLRKILADIEKEK